MVSFWRALEGAKFFNQEKLLKNCSHEPSIVSIQIGGCEHRRAEDSVPEDSVPVGW